MPRIYLYQDPVDFRKSFRSLAAIVEQELGHNPFEGALYAFTNRRRDKIKLLYWEDNRCQPWRAKRRLVDPSSREAALFSRRALRQRENKVGLRTRRPVIWESSTEQQRACEVVA
ncbi:IS66 family insertion sequence element accessory protein TnpB [Thiolapillus sp.]